MSNNSGGGGPMDGSHVPPEEEREREREREREISSG